MCLLSVRFMTSQVSDTPLYNDSLDLENMSLSLFSTDPSLYYSRKFINVLRLHSLPNLNKTHWSVSSIYGSPTFYIL